MQVMQFLLSQNEQNLLGKNEDESQIVLVEYVCMLLRLKYHGTIPLS